MRTKITDIDAEIRIIRNIGKKSSSKQKKACMLAIKRFRTSYQIDNLPTEFGRITTCVNLIFGLSPIFIILISIC